MTLTNLILLGVLSFSSENARGISSDELPSKMSFFSNQLKQPDLESSYRFKEIAAVAKLPIVLDPISLGYEVGFHFAATQPKFEKTILFAFGRKINPEFTEQIYKSETGHFYQLNFNQKQASLFFLGFNESEVKNIISRYKKVYQTSSSAAKSQRAPASSEVAKGSTGGAVGTHTATEHSLSYAVGESFKKCAIGTVEGANNTAKAILVDPVVALWHTATRPKEVWANTVAQWETIKNNLVHFEAFAERAIENFKSLPEAEKSRLYCSFVGSGGAGGLAFKGASVATNSALSKRAVANSKILPKNPELDAITKLRESGVASTDPRITSLRKKLIEKLPDVQKNTAHYVHQFYPDFPDDALLHIVKNARSYQYTGNELKLRSPFPGADSVTFYFGKNGSPSSMSVFLGWGRTHPAREQLIGSGQRLGLKTNLNKDFRDGFMGTSDPQTMMNFLRTHLNAE